MQNTATVDSMYTMAPGRSTLDPGVLSQVVSGYFKNTMRNTGRTAFRALALPVFFLSTMRGSRRMSFAVNGVYGVRRDSTARFGAFTSAEERFDLWCMCRESLCYAQADSAALARGTPSAHQCEDIVSTNQASDLEWPYDTLAVSGDGAM